MPGAPNAVIPGMPMQGGLTAQSFGLTPDMMGGNTPNQVVQMTLGILYQYAETDPVNAERLYNNAKNDPSFANNPQFMQFEQFFLQKKLAHAQIAQQNQALKDSVTASEKPSKSKDAKESKSGKAA